MQWYSHLYVGRRAKRHRYAIIQGIREEKLQPEVYVITSPQNGENLCDIYPSAMLLFPSEKKKERMILGIAVTYWEALEVTRQIIDELYRNTGGFDLAGYLNDHSNAPCTSGRDNQARNMSEHVPEAGEM